MVLRKSFYKGVIHFFFFFCKIWQKLEQNMNVHISNLNSWWLFWLSNYLIQAIYNCLFSFIIFATLGSNCHARSSVFYQFLPEWMFFKIIIFVERTKNMWHFKYFASTYIIQNICEIITLQHEVPESQKCYVGQPQLLCTYLDLLFWIRYRLIQNKLFVWRASIEIMSW